LGGLLIPAMAQAGFSSVNIEEVLARSEKFAVQASGCTLLDGYRCQHVEEQDFLTAAAQSAWQAALTVS
jgi:hypothetical protein